MEDAVNALFEGLGAVLAWTNFVRLRKDREIKGVYWPVTAFFAAWGLWNLFYYPSLGQWLSGAAGCVLCAANAAWVFLALRILRKGR